MTPTATRKRRELASLSREEDSQDVASYTKFLDFYVSDKCYSMLIGLRVLVFLFLQNTSPSFVDQAGRLVTSTFSDDMD